MGMTLSALGQAMSSDEFALHMALEVERMRPAADPNALPDDWFEE